MIFLNCLFPQIIIVRLNTACLTKTRNSFTLILAYLDFYFSFYNLRISFFKQIEWFFYNVFKPILLLINTRITF